jgi:NAD(P)-dependent dehydrogenase (short-subunit alcohol dehydrogenase family)
MLLGLFETLSKTGGANATDIETAFARQLSLGRLASPLEIANAILFLASNESSYVNAELLTVDGGAHFPTMLS